MRVKQPRLQVPGMARRSSLSTFIFFLSTCALIALIGCGGKNGVIGTGGGASLTSITLTPTNPTITLSLSPASTQKFDTIGHYSFGNPKDITDQLTWLSLDTTVATIDSKGSATAVGSGRVVITGAIIDPASNKTFQVSTVLTVVPQLTGITISPASAQIAKGTARQFTAIGQYNDGTSPDITALVAWKSTQPGVASVSSSPGTQGRAVGAAAGSTSISASLGAVSSAPSSLSVSSASLTSITVSPASSTVPLATSQQLVATGTFDDGSTEDLSRDVTWTTLNPHSRVARVSATGIATGLGLGSETITAAAPSSGISGNTTVTVDESSVTAINVLPLNMVMFPGALFPEPVVANGTKQQMRAVAVINDGSSIDITGIQGVDWSSTDTSVATIVSDSGLMTTAGPGSTNLIAALGSRQGSTSVNVLTATLQSLVVAPTNAQVAQGGVQNVVALATFLAPDNLTLFQQDVSNAATWSGDANASVNYVDGLLELATGVASGTSMLSASLTVPGGSSATGTASLNVSSGQLGTISLVPGSAAVPLDGGRQFRATGNFTDGTQADLSLLANWGSSDEAITTVSPFGFSNASGPGQTSVRATFMNPVTGTPVTGSGTVVVNPAALVKIDICAATVSNPVVNCPPLDPFPPPPGISFANQTQFGLVAIGTYSDGNRQDLTDAVRWSSASPDAATVSDDAAIPGITTGVGQRGVLTGDIQGGTAIITATAGGISGTVPVTVTPATVQSLAVTPANGGAALGVPQQLKVTGSFSDGSKQDVTSSVQWSSLNPDIAIVTPGGVAYTAGKGITTALQGPSSLVVSPSSVILTIVNPSATSVFPWPVGSVFQLHGLTSGSGDVSLLNELPFTILSVTDPADSQHLQPCKPGQNCNLTFAPPALAPAAGAYAVTGGTAQVSALIKATMNVIVNSELTQVSGTTTLTIQ
jgi:hypothetical protein